MGNLLKKTPVTDEIKNWLLKQNMKIYNSKIYGDEIQFLKAR